MIRSTRKISTFFSALTLSLLLAGATHAATLDVCASGCSYSTVTSAVAAASSGDVIELEPETFNEGGITIDKNLTIRSASGMATIDAGSHGWVFKITSGTLVDLEDLRLQGGTYARIDNSGHVDLSTVWVIGQGFQSTMGGLFNRASGVMVIADASVVASNRSLLYGGGITNYGGLIIINSTVTGNHGKHGGGLHNLLGTASVMASSFSFNIADRKGGAWANLKQGGNAGTVAFHGSSSTSDNVAHVDCDVSWDQSGPTCTN